MTNLRKLAPLVLLPGLLAACSPAEEKTPNSSSTSASAAGGSAKSPVADSAPAQQTESAQKVTISGSGFGQQGEYVWVTALVKATGAQPGDFVVVNFNVKDAKGTLLKSDSQTESFYKTGQEMALGTQVDLPAGVKAASVEATAAISNNLPPSSTLDVAVGPVTVTANEYGGTSASFEATNPSNDSLTGTRFGVICKDAGGTINGGGVAYPDLLPANGKVKVDVTGLLTSGAPAQCKAYYQGLL